MQCPQDRRLHTPEVFFANQGIKRSTVHYVNLVNKAVKLLGQQYYDYDGCTYDVARPNVSKSYFPRSIA